MHRPAPRFIATLLAAALAAGCSSDQARTDDAPQRTAAAPTAPSQDGLVSSGRTFTGGQLTTVGSFVIDHDAWGRIGYRWDWSSAAPLVAGRKPTGLYAWPDLVATTDSGTVVTVLDPVTGKIDWTARTDTPTARLLGLVRDGDRLVAGTNTRLYELDASKGNILSFGDIGYLVSTPPTVFGNRVVFGAPTCEVIVYNRTVKLPVSRYDAGAGITAAPLHVSDRTVGAITEAGEVLFLDIVDNTAVSRFKIYGDTAGVPATDAGYVWVASRDQSVYLFDANEGVRPWRFRTPYTLTKAPVLIDDALYVASPGGLYKLNADGRDDAGIIRSNGVQLWLQEDLADATVVGTLHGDLLTWSGSILSRVDPENGDIIEQARVPGITNIATDAFDDGALYLQTTAGDVIRFRPR